MESNGQKVRCEDLIRETIQQAEEIASLAVETDSGGLILIGPDACAMSGLDSLLELPEVEPVVARSELLLDWRTVTAEVVAISRLASRLIRNGQTPVIYLDTHVGSTSAVPNELRDFVCRRLSQILIGLAEEPAYVAVHGDQMVQTLIVESLGDTEATALGRVDDEFPIWKLSEKAMFRGLPFGLCPGNREAAGVAQLHTWFERRRVRKDMVAAV